MLTVDILTAADLIAGGEEPVFRDGAGILSDPDRAFVARAEPLFEQWALGLWPAEYGSLRGVWNTTGMLDSDVLEVKNWAFRPGRNKDECRYFVVKKDFWWSEDRKVCRFDVSSGYYCINEPTYRPDDLFIENDLINYVFGAGEKPECEFVKISEEYRGLWPYSNPYDSGRADGILSISGNYQGVEISGVLVVSVEKMIAAASGKVIAYKSAETLSAWTKLIRARRLAEMNLVSNMDSAKRISFINNKINDLNDYVAKFPAVAAGVDKRLDYWHSVL